MSPRGTMVHLLVAGLILGCVGRAAADVPAAFAKPVPETLGELQAIQDHVQALVAKVAPCTVGLRIGQAQGSGVIIDKVGHVLTAGHVSGEPGRKVTILLPDGRKLHGITLGANAGIDSGLVKITDTDTTFPHLDMAKSADLARGQWCLALGHPGGYQTGRAPVVRLGRILEASNKVIRTDCALVGGDSGGPLFNMDGKVIGIHSRIGGALTFNLHVPIDTYRETWDRLVASETWGKSSFFDFARPAEAYLGVRADPEAPRVKVLSVSPESPAAKAGLQTDDVILDIDGQKLATADDLGKVLRGKRPGVPVALNVRRGEATQIFRVILGKRPGEFLLERAKGPLPMRLVPLLLLLLLPAPVLAQKTAAELLRSNPKFLHAFHDATAKPSASVVRVLCDGKETALGVVVAPDGWVLTKAYDLKGKITCKLRDGVEVPARLVGVQPVHDLAMLQIATKGLTPIAFADSKEVKAGSWVASVGLADDPVAVGVVGVPTRNLVTKGPRIIDPAKAPYLGVALDVGEEGLLVTQIMPNSGAAQAGLKVNDTILKLDGTRTLDLDEFVGQLAKRKIGAPVKLSVRRGKDTLDVEATLQSRPAGSARAELQNRMGSELSSRKGGYPTILQHDSVIKPHDCGGPLVDLQGRVLGINISRAGRTESYAIPSEVITPLLADLRSGKLSPPPEEKAATSADLAVDALLAAMRRRLLLMPDVARAKWNVKQMQRDAPREAEVIARLVAEGKVRGLDAAEAQRFIAAQIEAAWLVQEDRFIAWQKTEQQQFDAALDLKEALRPRVDAASSELLDAYAAARPHLSAERLRERARILLTGDGITDAVRERALGPLLDR